MKNYKFQLFVDCSHLCFDLFLPCSRFSLLTFIKFSIYLRLQNFSYNCIFWHTELTFLHVIVMLSERGLYCLFELKFQFRRPSWKFNPGWKFPYSELLNLFVSISAHVTMQNITILDNIFGKKWNKSSKTSGLFQKILCQIFDC